MRTIRMLSCALLVGAMAVVTPGGAASAAPATTYTGEFEGPVMCDSEQVATTSGDWSMTLHGTSAKGTFVIDKTTMGGEVAPTLAYTFPMMKQAPVGTDYVFSVHGVTQAGLLTVSLKVDGNMTYTIAPYNYDGLECTSVTYPGHLTS